MINILCIISTKSPLTIMKWWCKMHQLLMALEIPIKFQSTIFDIVKLLSGKKELSIILQRKQIPSYFYNNVKAISLFSTTIYSNSACLLCQLQRRKPTGFWFFWLMIFYQQTFINKGKFTGNADTWNIWRLFFMTTAIQQKKSGGRF